MKSKLNLFLVISTVVISAALAVAQSTMSVTEQRQSTDQSDNEATTRGHLLRSDFIASASREEVALGLANIGWPDVVVKSGVVIRRLVYTTVNAHGAPTIASGLLALPTDIAPIGVVSFEHGTSSQKMNVPSTPGSGQGQAVSALFASGGFALVAPDYVGLGLSPGPHPYLHADSEATASLDLLEAARRAAREANVKLPRSVFITGFSQGGQAAFALDHVIETSSELRWKVVALASIAGPYDLSGTEFPDLLDGPSPTSSAYLAYLALSYIQIYGAVSTSEVFTSPWDVQVISLFDGQHPLDEIAQSLPVSPRALFRPEFLAGVSNGSGPFLCELRENDMIHANPRASVRLYYGEADVDVFPRNTDVAVANMTEAGVPVTLVDLGPRVDHPTSADLGLRSARAWFDQLVSER